MTVQISNVRDDFADNSVAAAWLIAVLGSATVTETGGQAVITLPSSAAGSHQGSYRSHGTYDLTGDGFVWNIATMVATGVAAAALFQLLTDATGVSGLYWKQQSNAITAHSAVGGVDTQLFTATWSAATYKYLRIRESGGTIFFDSSTNGTTWTNRASVANPFAVTSMIVQWAATCGTVASPGSLKLDDVNLILPALATNWHWVQGTRALLNRVRSIGLSANGGQGCIVTATAFDSSGTFVGPRYFSGPLGSSSGGYNQLVECTSLAQAQAMAVNLPADGRWDLPLQVECRIVRLYLRSINGAPVVLNEDYPRRLVQSDDIEAETIQTINLAAGSVTADKIFVLNLAAVSAFIGQLSIDPTGWIYQGTGTGAAPTTGLKIFNSGGIGKLSTYNAGVEQVTFDTDGKLKAGAGAVKLDATGIDIVDSATFLPTNAYTFSSGGVVMSGLYGAIDALFTYAQLWVKPQTTIDSQLFLYSDGGTGHDGQIAIRATGGAGFTSAEILMDAGPVDASMILSATYITLDNLNVGTGASAGFGQIATSGNVAFGAAVPSSVIRCFAHGAGTTSATYSFYGEDSAAAARFYVRNDGVGFLGTTAWTYASDASKKKNVRALNKDIVDFMKLDGKVFDFIDGAANRMGYMAQDVQLIMPDLVETLPDGTLGLRTDEINILAHAVLKRLIRVLLQKNVIGPADIA